MAMSEQLQGLTEGAMIMRESAQKVMDALLALADTDAQKEAARLANQVLEAQTKLIEAMIEAVFVMDDHFESIMELTEGNEQQC